MPPAGTSPHSGAQGDRNATRRLSFGSSLEGVPQDVLEELIGTLGHKDLCLLAQCSKRFAKLAVRACIDVHAAISVEEGATRGGHSFVRPHFRPSRCPRSPPTLTGGSCSRRDGSSAGCTPQPARSPAPGERSSQLSTSPTSRRAIGPRFARSSSAPWCSGSPRWSTKAMRWYFCWTARAACRMVGGYTIDPGDAIGLPTRAPWLTETMPACRRRLCRDERLHQRVVRSAAGGDAPVPGEPRHRAARRHARMPAAGGLACICPLCCWRQANAGA